MLVDRPTRFLVQLSRIKSYGWAEYTYDVGCDVKSDSFEDSEEERLFEETGNDLEVLLEKVLALAPTGETWAVHGACVATAREGKDRYSVLVCGEDDFCWLFTLDDLETATKLAESLSMKKAA